MPSAARPDTDAGPGASEAAAAWLRLSLVRGIGPRLGRQLVAACGSVESLWRKSPAEWAGFAGIGTKLIQALAHTRPDHALDILRQCENSGIQMLCPDDAQYPAPLLSLDDAPLVLFVKGDVAALQYPRLLAVVGSRRASREGRLLARRWCRSFSGRGIGIVSGMAYGIDAAAHHGALEADAPTIAVLGCGLGFSLTPEQQRQAKAIAAHGCVISEFLPEEEPRPGNFPRRNRIIAGLAAATLVVEAGVRSGSLITARQTADYGREVLAVPGSVLAGDHAGCHQLIRDGATLAESTGDVLRVLGWQTSAGTKRGAAYTPADAHEARIMEALRRNILHMDALAENCGLTVPELSPILLGLELLGVVERLSGSRYTLGNGSS